MKGLYIVNPNSGMRILQVNAHTMARNMLRNGKLTECRFVYTQKGGDGFDAAAALKPGEYDFVLAAGGDGTVSEVVNGLMTSGCGIPLLILGAGTTNDFSTVLDLGTGPLTLERLATDYYVREVDVGICNGRYFTNVTAGGMLTAIAHSTSPELKSVYGKMAYYAEGMRELGSFKLTSTRLRYISDKETIEEDTFLFAVANSTQSGGFSRIAPLAKLDDGKIDVCILKPFVPAEMIPLFNKIQTGMHPTDRNVKYFQTKKLRIELCNEEDSVAVDCDGENAGSMPLEISVAPEKLKLIVPRHSTKAKKLFTEWP
ncbi:MAG: diacylglycerol kinase family lipid kinase [Clostridia bacterium]|nr:diacylglycerol kinase family lipid kinase [Clostridia bacterium]